MKLKNAVFENTLKINNTVVSLDDMIKYLKSAKDIVADVKLSNKPAFTGTVKFYEDNNYLIANVDCRFGISACEPISTISIELRQANTSSYKICASSTPVSTSLDTGDVDADLYFKVVNLAPNCTTRCYVPDSKFKYTGEHKIASTTLVLPVSVDDTIVT